MDLVVGDRGRLGESVPNAHGAVVADPAIADVVVGDAVVPGHVFRGNPAVTILFVSPRPGLADHDPVGADVGHEVAFNHVVATSDADADSSAARVLDGAVAEAAPRGILPAHGRVDVVPVFLAAVVLAIFHVDRVVEAGLYAVVAQLGQRPIGILEPQPAEMDVLDRLLPRAVQFQQTVAMTGASTTACFMSSPGSGQ